VDEEGFPAPSDIEGIGGSVVSDGKAVDGQGMIDRDVRDIFAGPDPDILRFPVE
jgi:hypothetical protein